LEGDGAQRKGERVQIKAKEHQPQSCLKINGHKREKPPRNSGKERETEEGREPWSRKRGWGVICLCVGLDRNL